MAKILMTSENVNEQTYQLQQNKVTHYLLYVGDYLQ